ncbi:MAG: hypothetical protein EOO39_07205 [Cytophagaceae bacterium]|nr:MAG: hypothetical protein EOO39_07205 [Cytophagaceae bacterium]
MKPLYFILLLCGLSFTGCKKSDPVTPTTDPLQHLHDARELVDHISQANTTYQHGASVVTWKTPTTPYQSYTDCSGFINALLQKSYLVDSLQFKTWLGAYRPHAFNYYDAVIAKRGFDYITQVGDIQPGDLITLKYVDSAQHDENTGHCLLVDELPKLMTANDIQLPNTTQYSVRVIDSTEDPHGTSDTRHLSATDKYTGLGKGTFRLYADPQGNVVGYSWSELKPNAGFDPQENPIAIGRQTSFGGRQ